jgi:hypothetical protein
MSQKLSPLEEVLKALQSIVRERPGGNPKITKTKGCAIVEEYVPIGRAPPTTDLLVTSTLKYEKTDQIPWQDDFLRKSPSFLQALRQSG